MQHLKRVLDNMMFKCVLCLCILVLRVKCLSEEDNCSSDSQPGTCKPLSECTHLLSEIKSYGNPMPQHMRDKLQRLGCGFLQNQPLVCCQSNENTPNIWSSFEPNDSDGTNNAGSTEDPTLTNNGGLDVDRGGDNVLSHRNIDLLPTNCGIIEGDRIFGGNRTSLFEMPWMVLLSYDSARGTRLSCGGTLITKWYILTAAHCVSFLGTKLTLRKVILGEYDVRKDPDCERVQGELICAPNVRNVEIDSIIPHADYTPQTLGDDIALVRLAEPADFTLDSMKPICLPISAALRSEVLEGLQGVVAGWGATEEGLQSPVLLSVDLPIISNTDCQFIYNGLPRIQDTQLCAGGVPDKDSCGGDSGGPLMYPGATGAVGARYVQRGIVSYGSKRCGVGGLPGVYTRVSKYMNWILDNIRG